MQTPQMGGLRTYTDRRWRLVAVGYRSLDRTAGSKSQILPRDLRADRENTVSSQVASIRDVPQTT